MTLFFALEDESPLISDSPCCESQCYPRQALDALCGVREFLGDSAAWMGCEGNFMWIEEMMMQAGPVQQTYRQVLQTMWLSMTTTVLSACCPAALWG